MKKVFHQAQNNEKGFLRKAFHQSRRNIPLSRKNEAFAAVFSEIEVVSKTHRFVLSYASCNDELCTLKINTHLAKNGKLLLPKVHRNDLTIFHVTDPKMQLTVSSWGIPEPIPDICPQAELANITCVLVPGLAFDSKHYRLGYGKGFYDRFLHGLPSNVTSYGIGFKEQFRNEPLPTNPRDFSHTKLLLF